MTQRRLITSALDWLDQHRPRASSALRNVVANPELFIGVTVFGLLIVGAILAGPISGHDPNAQDAGSRLAAPSFSHVFGTDELRRDLCARTLYGLRLSLLVAIGSVGVGGVVGSSLGLVAGYRGGWTERLILRVVDAMLAFPGFLTALAILTILGPGSSSIGIAIVIYMIPAFIRLARAQTLIEKAREYVLAAQAIGATPQRVVFRHIGMSAFPPLITQAALAVAGAVMLEAALSFLGLGQRPPSPTLGGLIASAKAYLGTDPWYAFFPASVFVFLLLSMNLLCDGLTTARRQTRRGR